MNMADENFARRTRGVTTQGIDDVMVKLVDDVYAPKEQRKGAPELGWRPLTDSEMLDKGINPAKLVNKKSGLQAHIYTDDDGNVALVFVGSNERRDWIPTNFGQGLGIEVAQYKQAIELSKGLKEIYGNNLIIAGHSLGGGLAAASSMATGAPAVTFNAAGVHRRTIERLDIDFQEAKQLAAAGNIRNYRVDGEFLTHAQEKMPLVNRVMPDAVGVQIDIPNPDPSQRVGLGRRMELHKMKAVGDSYSLYRGLERGELSKAEVEQSVVNSAENQQSAETDIKVGNGNHHPLITDVAHPNHELYLKIAQGLPEGTGPRIAANITLQAMENGIDTPSKVGAVHVAGNDVYILGSGCDPGLRSRTDLNAPTPDLQEMSDHMARETAQQKQYQQQQQQQHAHGFAP